MLYSGWAGIAHCGIGRVPVSLTTEHSFGDETRQSTAMQKSPGLVSRCNLGKRHGAGSSAWRVGRQTTVRSLGLLD